ncbi:MAG: hypothetical protein QNM02_03750 [Acidimicrobiia bacterium]|nr:hypothetical protein [Acidimicrobiia bacterium]
MADTLKRVLDDLLNIEVNTMVKPGMTGRKMPAFGHALLDIHAGYERWLNRYSIELNAQWSRFRGTPVAEQFRVARIGAGEEAKWWVIQDGALIDRLETAALTESAVDALQLFEATRTEARVAEEVHRLLDGRRGYSVRDGGDVILMRIVRNCDQLKSILERVGTGGTVMLSRGTAAGITDADTDKLPREDLITVRKAWEMGTEEIAMQTVVQLDGDIVTRLNSAYAGEEDQPVRDIHRESVGSALAHWQYLVDTVVALAKSGLGVFT